MGDSWIERLQQKVWYWMDHAGDTPQMTPAEQKEWQDRTRFENSYHSANVVAGVCQSPTVSQVRDLLTHAAALTKKARQTIKWANKLGALEGAFADAATALGKTEKFGGGANAACDMSEAIAVLNDWVMPNSRVTNLEAAKAFDKLVGAAAVYMKMLPPPANAFGQIFDEIRKDNFVSNFTRELDPENPNTPSGQTLRGLRYDGS